MKPAWLVILLAMASLACSRVGRPTATTCASSRRHPGETAANRHDRLRVWLAFGRRHRDDNGHEHSIGTLIVDLVDTERKDLVWRGKATDTIGSDSEAREQQLREAVSKMFEGFPASRGGK